MPRRPLLIAAVLLFTPLLLAGCLQRRMVIRSNPQGAVVVLDGETLPERTPVTVPFTWDGTRAVTLAAPGHRVLDAEADLEAKWYDWFPLDFVAEFLWPLTIEDVRTFDYTLEKLDEQNDPGAQARIEELLRRADAFRAGGSDGPAPQGE